MLTVHSNHIEVIDVSIFDLFLTITNYLCIACVTPENIKEKFVKKF